MYKVVFELRNGIEKEIGVFSSEMTAWEQAFRCKMNWSVKNIVVKAI